MIPPTIDLEDSEPHKDVSKSCVFDFPDRPPDTLPPDYPPLNPPVCYPYCPGDDWPVPPTPPGVVIPPDAIPLGPGYTDVEAGFVQERRLSNGRPYMQVGITGLGDLGSFDGAPFDMSGFPTGPSPLHEYLGGAAIDSDHIAEWSRSIAFTINYTCDINLVRLLAEVPGINTFLIRISFGQFQADPPIESPGFPFNGSGSSDSSNGVDFPTYSVSLVGDGSSAFVFEWYLSRSSGLYCRGFADDTLIFPSF